MADEKRSYGAALTPSDVERERGKSILKGIYGGSRYDPLTEEGASQENIDANRAQRRARGQLGYSKGGMVKHGSPKLSAPCRDTKTIKC